MASLDTRLDHVVGGRAATALAKALDFTVVRDLLFHYPRRYAERGELTDLDALSVGDQATIVAEIRRVNVRRMRNRPGKLLEIIVGEGCSALTLTFFNQPWRERELVVGRRGLFAGKVTEFRGKRQLNSPDYQLLEDAVDGSDEVIDEFAGALIPVYPSTAGLPSWVISRCVRQALQMLDPPHDPIPENIRRNHKLLDFDTALRHIHQPASWHEVTLARTRLKWNEALTLQVTLAQRRQAAVEASATSRPPYENGLLDAFDAALPFTLTAGQRTVGDAIASDLAMAHPMHRLLQGEVGSGKTVVALRAMLQVVDAGGQAALLAPTEVLAAQHARSLRQLLGSLATSGELGSAERSTRIALLTGSLSTAGRRVALLDAASGAAGIVVGTHALIQESVTFADLGLVVIDEQHRFGVEQRDALRMKGHRPPHVLVMTATPIPRTVAMTVYGDLEVSALRELPGGRSPIATTVVPSREKPSWLDRVWQRVREEVARGRQVYIVCPRIGEASDDTPPNDPEYAGNAANEDSLDEDGGLQETARAPISVVEMASTLANGPLDGLRIDVLHGRLSSDAKDAVMRRFAAGDIDVLIATTVVEVGVDVPNATVMVVMDADRFGVSQLHQLRGRVGRGLHPGLCLLVTDSPADSVPRERLSAVASTVDGFELARLDLEQRREGDVLGQAQSGRRSTLRLLSLLKDEELIAMAREEASALVSDDPSLAHYSELAREVEELTDDEKAEYLEKT